jgi:TRAP-type C4-dicarboxylate transport system substrate-binding protein
VQPYASATRHAYNPLVVLFSKKTWDRMSPDERKIVQDAASEAGAYERKVSREANEKSAKDLQAKGMKINAIAPQEIARMRDKVKPVNDKYVKEGGDALAKEMFDAIDKVRGGKKS